MITGLEIIDFLHTILWEEEKVNDWIIIKPRGFQGASSHPWDRKLSHLNLSNSRLFQILANIPLHRAVYICFNTSLQWISINIWTVLMGSVSCPGESANTKKRLQKLRICSQVRQKWSKLGTHYLPLSFNVEGSFVELSPYHVGAVLNLYCLVLELNCRTLVFTDN